MIAIILSYQAAVRDYKQNVVIFIFTPLYFFYRFFNVFMSFLLRTFIPL